MNCYNELRRYSVCAGATFPWLLALTDTEGNALSRAQIVSMTFDLYELGDRLKTAVDTSGLPLSTGHYDTIPTTALSESWHTDWAEDSRGYNLAYHFNPPLPDKVYRGVLTVSLNNAEVVIVDALWITR